MTQTKIYLEGKWNSMLVDFMLKYEYSIKYVYNNAPLYKNGASEVLFSITITAAYLRLYL